jgi:hypothetical protein
MVKACWRPGHNEQAQITSKTSNPLTYNCWKRQLNIALGENHSGHATKVLFSEHVRHLAMLAILLMPFDFPTPNTFK